MSLFKLTTETWHNSREDAAEAKAILYEMRLPGRVTVAQQIEEVEDM
jgi:hypothetical protein